MTRLRQKISARLFAPTDAASLGMFRILFGALMIWQALHYLFHDRYIHYYIEPAFHFTYQFFGWVVPVSKNFMFGLLVVMTAAAAGIMLGLFFRLSALLFLLTYSYLFLLDKAFYNNHYYAIILLTFLLLVSDAQRWCSLDQRRARQPEIVPYWQLFLLKAQVFVIYFYGGLAKLNGDWLRGEPMRTWLQKVAHLPVVGPWMTTDWAPYFFSWGGLAFDLSIGFFLWWRKTRFAAFLAILFFNLTNNLIFNIGVFPFLMIGAATLFDDPDWPRKLFNTKTPAPNLNATPASRFASRPALAFVAVYLLIQALVPLRHWAIPGDVSWTEEGHFFSWHMKLRDKSGRLKIWVTDPKTGIKSEYDPHRDLMRVQRGKMLQRPQFIYQYVQHVQAEMEKKGIVAPVVQVDSFVSLNRRPFARLIDPEVNLAAAPISFFSHDPWILPLDPSLKPGTRVENPDEENEKAPGEEPEALSSESL